MECCYPPKKKKKTNKQTNKLTFDMAWAWKSSAPIKQGISVFVLCYVHNLELNEILCILVIQLSSKFRPLNCVISFCFVNDSIRDETVFVLWFS